MMDEAAAVAQAVQQTPGHALQQHMCRHTVKSDIVGIYTAVKSDIVGIYTAYLKEYFNSLGHLPL